MRLKMSLAAALILVGEARALFNVDVSDVHPMRLVLYARCPGEDYLQRITLARRDRASGD